MKEDMRAAVAMMVLGYLTISIGIAIGLCMSILLGLPIAAIGFLFLTMGMAMVLKEMG